MPIIWLDIGPTFAFQINTTTFFNQSIIFFSLFWTLYYNRNCSVTAQMKKHRPDEAPTGMSCWLKYFLLYPDFYSCQRFTGNLNNKTQSMIYCSDMISKKLEECLFSHTVLQSLVIHCSIRTCAPNMQHIVMPRR